MTDDVYLAAGDLAALLGVPLGTLHYWASVDDWPRTRSRPTRYSWTAAQQSYDRRRT